jgi:hypothetical protein
MRGRIGIFSGFFSASELTIESTATYQLNTLTTPQSVTLPSGIQAGDLLVMVIRAGSTTTLTRPGGWDEVATRSSTGVTYIWKRTANGSEGATVSVTLSTGTRMSAITYRVSGWVEGVEATFTGSNVNNPPSQTASWGSKRNLFIAVMTNRRSDSSVTAAPSGYGNLLTITQASDTGTTRVRVSTAHLFVEGATSDPAAFSTSGTINQPHSATIVIG